MGDVKGALSSTAAQFLSAGAILGGFTKALDFVVSNAADAELQTVRLNAVLKATGGAAGLSADELADMALEFSRLTGIEDETIIAAESVMLTFRSLGSEIFPQAMQAALDLSATMGTDLQGAVVMIGKALQEPIDGISALRRVGVMLSDQQEQQVKDFMAVGDVASAQGVILGELALEFGGVSEAMGETFQGRVNAMKTEFGNLAEILGGPIVDGVGAAAGGFVLLLQTIVDLNNATKINKVNWDYYAQVIEETTPIHEEAAEAMGNLSTTQKSTRDTLWDMVMKMQKAQPVVSDLTDELADLKEEEDEVADKMWTLEAAMDDALGSEMQDYSDNVADLTDKSNDLKEKIKELEDKSYLTDDQKQELADLKTELEGVSAEFEQNADDHETAVNRIIFNLAREQMALDGIDLSVQEQVLSGLAESLGLVNDKTLMLPIAIQTLTQAFSDMSLPEQKTHADDLTAAFDYVEDAIADGVLSTGEMNDAMLILEGKLAVPTTLGDNMQTAADGGIGAAALKAGQLAASIDDIEGEHNVGINISVYGDPIPNIPGPRPAPYVPVPYDAKGADFIVPAGYHDNYPLFVDQGERVQVTPAGQPGNNGSGGVNIENITINAGAGANGYDIFRQFEQALEAKMRANNRAGISYSDY
jgi:predicted  nucleic acid-binding Zn-ribbon protein